MNELEVVRDHLLQLGGFRPGQMVGSKELESAGFEPNLDCDWSTLAKAHPEEDWSEWILRHSGLEVTVCNASIVGVGSTRSVVFGGKELIGQALTVMSGLLGPLQPTDNTQYGIDEYPFGLQEFDGWSGQIQVFTQDGLITNVQVVERESFM